MIQTRLSLCVEHAGPTLTLDIFSLVGLQKRLSVSLSGSSFSLFAGCVRLDIIICFLVFDGIVSSL